MTTENNHNLSATLQRDTIYINTASGQGSQTTISVTVNNNSDTAAEIKSISILLPNTITVKPDAITPKADIKLWVFGKSPTIINQFDANAKTGKVVLEAKEALTFDLEKVKLVSTIELDPVFITVKIKFNNAEPAIVIPLNVILRSAKCSIDKFSVNKPVIKPGEAVELSWDTNKINYCILEPRIGEKKAKDSVTVKPKFTTVYTLWAYEANTILFAQLTVSVENPEITFTSTSQKILYGGRATLEWAANEYINTVILSNDAGLTPVKRTFTGDDAQSKKITIEGIIKPTTFKLLATKDETITADTQYLTREIKIDEIIDVEATFTATPNAVKQWKDNKVRLDWNIVSAGSVTITPALPDGPSLQKLSGFVEITVERDVTYTLTVTGLLDNKPKTITIPAAIKCTMLAFNKFTVSNIKLGQQEYVEVEMKVTADSLILQESHRDVFTLNGCSNDMVYKSSSPFDPGHRYKFTLFIGSLENPRMLSKTITWNR